MRLMGAYGGLWESMDKYRYVDVYGYLRESMCAYGSLCVQMGIYGCLWKFVNKYDCSSVYGRLWDFMGAYVGSQESTNKYKYVDVYEYL